MNCKAIKNQIIQPQGALALSADAQKHLSQCAECARAVKAARVQQLLFNAVARAETPEPLSGFEQRVLARARDQRAAPNGSTATIVGRLAWRLVPALAIIVVALVILGRDSEPTSQNGLTTLVTQGETLDDGWGSEMAQMFSFDQTGGGAR